MTEHVILAVVIQLAVVLAWRSWAAGAAVSIAWTLSREITQAEYRWIELYGAGRRANMPWWGGLDSRVWQNVDAWLDWLVPSLVVIAIASAARLLVRRC